MASDQHSTPEQRAVLRRKYGGVPPRSCGRCGGQTLTEYANERGVWWRCTYCGESGIADLDSDIVSALDDADALAGALAEIDWYKVALDFYAAADTYLASWPEPHDQATFEEAAIEQDRGKVARTALAVPTQESGQNRARMPQDAPQAATAKRCRSVRRGRNLGDLHELEGRDGAAAYRATGAVLFRHFSVARDAAMVSRSGGHGARPANLCVDWISRLLRDGRGIGGR